MASTRKLNIRTRMQTCGLARHLTGLVSGRMGAKKTGNRHVGRFPVTHDSSTAVVAPPVLFPQGSNTAQEMTVVHRPVSPSADWVILYELMILPLIL